MEQIRRYLASPADDGGAALRKLGGLLLGIGMLLVFFRRGNTDFASPWGEGALFFVLLAPAVFLYGAGLLGDRPGSGWQSLYLTFGIILVPLVLFQFIDWIGGDTESSLNAAWVFLATAALAAVAAYRGGLRYGLFLASVALIIAWLSLWNELLDDGLTADFGTFRGLLVAIALILLALAAAVRFRLPDGDITRAADVVTGAGAAAVLAGGLSVAQIVTFSNPFLGDANLPEASLLWDAELLVVSLLLVLFGVRFGWRGPVYVGALGLLVFVILVGFDLDDDSPAGKLIGWPLIVLLAGAAAFLASIVPGRRYGSLGIDRLEGGPSAGPPPPPPPPPPAAPPPPPAA